MNSSGIATTGSAEASADTSEAAFTDLVPTGPESVLQAEVRSVIPGPATLLPRASAGASETLPAMPDDDDFLVIEDVSTAITGTGEEVAVVSGEAFEEVEDAAAFAAEKGGAVIVQVPDSRLTVSGAVFASILLDQRNGILPNPFSLWTLPDRYVPPTKDETADQTVSGTDAMQDIPAEMNGLAMGREMSRLETAISQLGLRLEQMWNSIRTRTGRR